MKINIEVDLSECYAQDFDYDSELGASKGSSLSEAVINVIKSEVQTAISKQIKDDVKKLALDEYERFGTEKIKCLVEYEVNRFVQSGKVEKTYGKDMVTVNEFLQDKWNLAFSNMHSTDRLIKSSCNEFAQKCKDRYDMLFASNVVRGLNEQGLLKPGVFEAITSDSGE